jgi:hypothetical protein
MKLSKSVFIKHGGRAADLYPSASMEEENSTSMEEDLSRPFVFILNEKIDP